MKKLIVLTSNEYIRNYFESEAFSLINNEECYFCALDSISYRAPLENLSNFVGYFSLDKKSVDKNVFMFNVLMLRYKNRSITFKFRFQRQVLDLKNNFTKHLQELPEGPPSVKLLKKYFPEKLINFCHFVARSPATAKVFLRIAWNYCRMYFMGRPVLDKFATYYFERTTIPSPSLENIIKNTQPRLVILPTQAIDTVGNDVLRLKKIYHYETFFLIDNWDNLSSKSVFMYPPDYLGVWGKQSQEHATAIHKINTNRVFTIGTPRFEKYYALEQSLAQGVIPPSPYPFPYILFTGCSIAFDETSALELIDQVLTNYNAKQENPIKLLYRPHPWRATRKKEAVFLKEHFQHVQLDEQMIENYYAPKGDVFQPDLNYYPALLANAVFIIGPLTTMLLEASLLRKKVLAICYDDGVHFTSPHNALKYYKHFEGIEKIPGFYFSHSIDNLQQDVMHVLQSTSDAIEPMQHAHAIQYFLYKDSKSYPKRLNEALLQVKERKNHGSAFSF